MWIYKARLKVSNLSSGLFSWFLVFLVLLCHCERSEAEQRNLSNNKRPLLYGRGNKGAFIVGNNGENVTASVEKQSLNI